MDAPNEYNYGITGNYILEGCIKVLRYCFEFAKKNKEDTIVFLGDIHALKDKIPNKVKNLFLELLEEYRSQFDIYMLVGNHDYYNGELTIKYLSPFATIISESEIINVGDSKVVCVPYYPDVSKIIEVYTKYANEIDLLLGHFFVKTSLAGRFDAGAIPLKVMNQFKQVILGHDHVFQMLSANVTVLGSLYQEDWGEAGQQKYFYYNDQFHKLPLYINRQDVVIESNNNIEEIMVSKPIVFPGLFYFKRIICSGEIEPEKLKQLRKFYLDNGIAKVIVMPYNRKLSNVVFDISKGKDVMVQTMVSKSLQEVGIYQRFVAKQVLRQIMERSER